jgi:hypothetical protein
MQGHSEADRELLDAASLCRQLVPQGSVEAFLADHRHDLFHDAMFEDLFPSKRGRPSIPADVVAAVMVLQSLEGLSDRDAARALTDRISCGVRALLGRRGARLHGPHLLAHQAAPVRSSRAGLRGRALGDHGDRRAHGQALPRVSSPARDDLARSGSRRSCPVWLGRALIEVLTVGRSQVATSHVRVHALAVPELSGRKGWAELEPTYPSRVSCRGPLVRIRHTCGKRGRQGSPQVLGNQSGSPRGILRESSRSPALASQSPPRQAHAGRLRTRAA